MIENKIYDVAIIGGGLAGLSLSIQLTKAEYSVALFEKEKFLCKRIVFNLFDGKSISATVMGEAYQPLKHGFISELKPLTIDKLELGEVSELETGFYAQVFLAL